MLGTEALLLAKNFTKFLKYRHILKVACYSSRIALACNTLSCETLLKFQAFWFSSSTLLKKSSICSLKCRRILIHYTKQNFYGYHHCILLNPNKFFYTCHSSSNGQVFLCYGNLLLFLYASYNSIFTHFVFLYFYRTHK